MIEVGDLVVVVRPTPCCKKDGSIGKIYTVTGFISQARCKHCGEIYEGSVAVVEEAGRGEPVSRLKRIPPMGELDNLILMEEAWNNQEGLEELWKRAS